MEIYKEIEGNAFNACNVSDTPNAMIKTRKKDLNPPTQIMDSADVKVERN